MFKKPGPFKFGSKSKRQFDTLEEPLKKVLAEAIKIFDFSITEGPRTIDTQIRYSAVLIT